MPTQYTGGFVLQPKSGLYNNVIVLDFRSLYPSIIVTHNIDTSTFKKRKPISPAKKVPGFNYWFLKKPIGAVPKKIKKMLESREKIKILMNKISSSKRAIDKKKLDDLKKKEKSLKLATNIQYGLFGYSRGENFNIKVAESISAFGRYYIQETIKRARKAGFNIIYSDTDSIFLQGKNSRTFLSKINKWLPGSIKLEYRGKYKRTLFTNAKKRYALLGKNVEIRGFEAERGDWCPLAKETQQRVIELVLEDQNPKRALAYAKKVLRNLKKYPLSKFIISKQLSRPLHEYKARSAHIEVAKILASRSEELEIGDTIKYTINITPSHSHKETKHYQKAIPASDAKKSNLDLDYYRKKQIIPVVLRILSIFSIKHLSI